MALLRPRGALAAALLLLCGCPRNLGADGGVPPRAQQLNFECAQLYAAGELSQAKLRCELALEFWPDYGEAWTNLGLIHRRAGEPGKAKDAFIKAVRLNPDQAQAHVSLGVLYLDEGRAAEARDAFLRALRINPDFLEARYDLGLAYLQLREPDKAEDAFRKLLAIDPRIADAHRELGVLTFERDGAEAALPHFERAAALVPGKAVNWYYVGVTQARLGRRDDARGSLQSCLAAEPSHPGCTQALAELGGP